MVLATPAHAFWGNKNSEAQIEGYTKCVSDKRKAHSDAVVAYTEACGRQDDMSICMLGKPYEPIDIEGRCKDEYGIKAF